MRHVKTLNQKAARIEEFAPIKNASGDDSPASSHQIQSNRNGAWLERFGVKVDELLVSQPDSGEQALEITETLIRSEPIGAARAFQCQRPAA